MSDTKDKEENGPRCMYYQLPPVLKLTIISPHGLQVHAGTVSHQTVAGFQSGPFCQPIDITYPPPTSSGKCLAFPNPPNTPCIPPDFTLPTIMFAPRFQDESEASLYPLPMVTHFMLHRLAEASKVLTDTLVSACHGCFLDIETTSLRMHLFNAQIVLYYVWDVAVHANYVQDKELVVKIDNGSTA